MKTKKIEITHRLAEEIVDQLEGAQKDCYVQSTENILNDLKQALRIPIINNQRELFYNFITWYNAKPKVKKPKDGLITTTIIEEYLNI